MKHRFLSGLILLSFFSSAVDASTYTVVANQSPPNGIVQQWVATGGAFNEIATYSDTGSEKAVAWVARDGSNVTTASFALNLASGDMAWLGSSSQSIGAYTQSSGDWLSTSANELWNYNTSSRTWSRVAPSSAPTWNYDAGQAAWISGQHVWKWSPVTALWEYTENGNTTQWRYNFGTAQWAQMSGQALTPGAYPVQPVLQQMYSLMILFQFYKTGIYDQQWGQPSTVSGVATRQNATCTGLLKYTASTNTIEWLFSPNSLISLIYNTVTKVVQWKATYATFDVHTASYDGTTNFYENGSGTRSWSYSTATRTWSKQSSSITWQQCSTLYSWKGSEYAGEWTCDPVTGIWIENATGSTWRFSYYTGAWERVGSVQTQIASDGFPPAPVRIDVLIKTLLDVVDITDLVTIAAPVWNTFAFDGTYWTALNTANTQRIQYDPFTKSMTWKLTDFNVQGTYASATGAWTWDNVDIGTTDFNTGYNPTTGWFTDRGRTRHTWTYDASAKVWDDANSNVTWTQTGNEFQWLGSLYQGIFTYSPTANTWTESVNNSEWRYNLKTQSWERLSSGFFFLSPEQLPPLPLIQQQHLKAVWATTLVGGTGFITHTTLPMVMTDSNVDPQNGLWELPGHTLTVAVRETESPSIVYESDTLALGWTVNPRTNAWSFSYKNASAAQVSATYNPTTGIWTRGSQQWKLVDSTNQPAVGASGAWRNITAQPTGGEQWAFDFIQKQWRDIASDRYWWYEPTMQLWIEVKLQGSSAPIVIAWMFDFKTQVWTKAWGGSSTGPTKPPLVVIESEVMRTFIEGAVRCGYLSFDSFRDLDLERRNGGFWSGFNNTEGTVIFFDPALEVDPIRAYPNLSASTSWFSHSLALTIEANRSWTWTNSINPFQKESYTYNSQTLEYANDFVSTDAVWEYDPLLQEWSSGNEAWQYDSETSGFLDVLRSATWKYHIADDLWESSIQSSVWRYDVVAHKWTQITSTSAKPSFPPRVVALSMIALNMWKALYESGAFTHTPNLSLEQHEELWVGSDAFLNGLLLYDIRRSLPLSWSDSGGHTQVRYDGTSGEWVWRFKDQISGYNPAPSKKTWSIQGDTNGSQSWQLRTIEGDTYWIKDQSVSDRWMQVSSLVWKHVVTDAEWTYLPTTGQWTNADVGAWRYNFSLGVWCNALIIDSIPEILPPFPLMQYLFVNRIKQSVDSHFDQTLLINPQEVPISRYAHPLYGSRPLDIGSYYKRYNSPSILINAPLNLENLWFVHSDVSRNYGTLQLPSRGVSALPFIMGGERAYLQNTAVGPLVSLYNTTVACHEPLVVAGVRFNICEQPNEFVYDVLGELDNQSSFLFYNRGRAYDGLHRRGLVLQLGSAANRMQNGSILEVGSMRDAFIDVYRRHPSLMSEHDLPVTIECALDTARDAGAAQNQTAIHSVFFAHNSQAMIGWPSPVANESYGPWNIPLTGVESEDEGSFDPHSFGGGALRIVGTGICLSARDGRNMPPQFPVTSPDTPGVVCVEYGGAVTIDPNVDLTLDTIIARRLGQEENSGSVTLPPDQLILGEHGKVHNYGVNFTTGVNQSGPYAGNIHLSGVQNSLLIGAPFQAPSVAPFKGIRRRRAKKH